MKALIDLILKILGLFMDKNPKLEKAKKEEQSNLDDLKKKQKEIEKDDEESTEDLEEYFNK